MSIPAELYARRMVTQQLSKLFTEGNWTLTGIEECDGFTHVKVEGVYPIVDQQQFSVSKLIITIRAMEMKPLE